MLSGVQITSRALAFAVRGAATWARTPQGAATRQGSSRGSRRRRGSSRRGRRAAFVSASQQPRSRRLIGCWAEAHIKIARMTLTIKLDRNWSSFQLANSAPPLSVTDSATAPSARIVHCRSPKQHLSEILRCHILLLGGAHATAICCLSCLYFIYQAVA